MKQFIRDISLFIMAYLLAFSIIVAIYIIAENLAK